MVASVVLAVASWAADWPSSPSRGALSSPAIPIPDVAARASCKTDLRQLGATLRSGGGPIPTNETVPLPQPPRRLNDVRGFSGFVDPMLDDTSLWSEKVHPPRLPPDVVLDWISTRPRAFLWRGFASRSEAAYIRRLLLGSELNQHHGWDRGRDQWKIPLGTVPIIDRWTQALREAWPGMRYLRDFVAVSRSPPGPVSVREHYDTHVTSALLYLSDGGDGDGADKGGWTTFPDAGITNLTPDLNKGAPRCERGMQVGPRTGSLLGFYNNYPNSSMDLSAVHASCPTVGVDKWVVVWFFESGIRKFFGRVELDPV
eukprot:Hpha_TRINITY_DN15191_c4_g4::TRINITY_DN15191_c4_g4_i2::g.128441::m.128441